MSNFLRASKKWLILAVLASVLLGLVATYSFLVRTPQPPPTLVLSNCREATPGRRRIHSEFGTQFDVPERDFTIHSGISDMPPGMHYVVKLKDQNAQIVIWYDDDIFLKSAFPVFSEHVGERDVHSPNGSLFGKDHWGYLNTGERWRYVTFHSGDKAGYWPTPPKDAILLDQVINSACN